MKKIFKIWMGRGTLPLLFICLPALAFAQREILITAPDTIRDGIYFNVKIVVFPPIPNDFVYLKAIPAYPNPKFANGEDSLLIDSLSLFPYIIQMSDSGNRWEDTFFFKSKKKRPKDEWIKIQATCPGATDSSGAIFARYGPFESSKTNDQIRIIPNPIGTPGLPAKITIWRRGKVKEAEVKIFDSFGHLVRDLSSTVEARFDKKLPKKVPFVVDSLDMTREFSTLYTEWDGKNSEGTRVANGVYQLCVRVIQAEEAAIWKEKIGVIW